MDFGTLIFTKPERAITDVKYAEERGFTHAWIPDSHMIWGDTYACMALAAVNTKTIKLGTGVAIASNRIAPVTVHSIATINQLAPGRVILGFGICCATAKRLTTPRGSAGKSDICIAIGASSISTIGFRCTWRPTGPRRWRWPVSLAMVRSRPASPTRNESA